MCPCQVALFLWASVSFSVKWTSLSPDEDSVTTCEAAGTDPCFGKGAAAERPGQAACGVLPPGSWRAGSHVLGLRTSGCARRGLRRGGEGGTVYVGAHVRAHAGGARGGAKHAAALEAVSA